MKDAKWADDLLKIAHSVVRTKADDLVQEFSLAILEAGCRLDSEDTAKAIEIISKNPKTYLSKSLIALQNASIFSTENQKKIAVTLRRVLSRITHDNKLDDNREKFYNNKEIPFDPKELNNLIDTMKIEECGKRTRPTKTDWDE